MAEIPRFVDHQERQKKLRLLIAESESNFVTAISQGDVANERMRQAVTNMQMNITNKLEKFSEDVNGKLDNLIQSINNLQSLMLGTNDENALLSESKTVAAVSVEPTLVNSVLVDGNRKDIVVDDIGKVSGYEDGSLLVEFESDLSKDELTLVDDEAMSLVLVDELVDEGAMSPVLIDETDATSAIGNGDEAISALLAPATTHMLTADSSIFPFVGITILNSEHEGRKTAEKPSATAYQITDFCENGPAEKFLFYTRFEDGKTCIRSISFGCYNYDDLKGSLESKKGYGQKGFTVKPEIVNAATTDEVRATTKATSISIRRLEYRPFDRGKYATAEVFCSPIKILVRKDNSLGSYSFKKQWCTHEKIHNLLLQETIPNHTERKLNEETPHTSGLPWEIFAIAGQLRRSQWLHGQIFYPRKDERQFGHNQEGNDRNFVGGKEEYIRFQPLCQNLVAKQTLKLAVEHHGPFEIWVKTGTEAYKLELTSVAQMHRTILVTVVNISLSPKVYHSPSQFLMPCLNGGPENAICEDDAKSKFSSLDPWGQGSFQDGGIVMNPVLDGFEKQSVGDVAEMKGEVVDEIASMRCCLKKAKKIETGLNVSYGLDRKGVG